MVAEVGKKTVNVEVVELFVEEGVVEVQKVGN